jgi:hypothetical protein
MRPASSPRATRSSGAGPVCRALRRGTWILTATCLAGLAACTDSLVAPDANGAHLSASPTSGGLTVTPPEATVARQATVKLEAFGGNGKGNIQWSSSASSVATVSSSGLVTGVAPGAVTITARHGNRSGTASITVTSGETDPPGVHHVPPSIVADCSVDVTGALHTWFASVPDNSTLMFGKDACYNIDTGLIVTDRIGLTFDGNGSTFRVFSEGDPNRSNWTIRAGRDITLRNMIARGANPNAGVGNPAYVPRLEWQHGYRFQGTQTGTLEHVQAYDVYGDFVEAEPDWTRVAVWPGEPARNITVRHSRFERNGRMGIALTHVDGFVLEDSHIGDVRWSAIDLELDDPRAIGWNVRIERNTFGPVRHGIFTNFGQGVSTSIRNVVFSHNVMVANPVTCIPPVWAGTPGEGVYWTGYRFEGNTLRTYGNGFEMTRTRDVVIRDNTVHLIPGGGCGRDEAVRVRDSHGGLVTGNAVHNAPRWYSIFRGCELTTNFSVWGNSLQ